jgi:hypothetical protein
VCGVPSWLFWDIYSQQCLPTLSQRRTFRHKSQSIKVHIRTTDNGNKLFAGPHQLLVQDIPF